MAEDLDDAVVAVREHPADRHHAEDDERGHHREQRREAKHERIGAFGDQVFLEEELDAVGEGLEDAPGPGDVRPHPVLHVGDELALEPDHEHDRHEQQHERQHDLQRDDQDHRRVDVALQQRVAADLGEQRDHGVSTRTSVTAAVASMRSVARTPC